MKKIPINLDAIDCLVQKRRRKLRTMVALSFSLKDFKTVPESVRDTKKNLLLNVIDGRINLMSCLQIYVDSTVCKIKIQAIKLGSNEYLVFSLVYVTKLLP